MAQRTGSDEGDIFASDDRIALRRLSPADLDAFLAHRSDPQVARFQTWESMDLARATGFLAHCQSVPAAFRAGQWTQIAVADAVTDELLGDMGLHLSGDGTEAELGITLARAFHRKGIATSAMRMAIAMAFDRQGLSRVICGADQRNLASLGLITKLGFRWTHRETDPLTGVIDEMFELSRAG